MARKTTAAKAATKPSTGATAAAAPPKGLSNVSITLSQEVLDKLGRQVSFRTAADVQRLVADAINTYVQLGQISASGAKVFARDGDDGKPVRLHFPFDPRPGAAG